MHHYFTLFIKVFISDFLILVYLGCQKSILKTPVTTTNSRTSYYSSRCLELSLIGLSTLTGRAHRFAFDLNWN